MEDWRSEGEHMDSNAVEVPLDCECQECVEADEMVELNFSDLAFVGGGIRACGLVHINK